MKKDLTEIVFILDESGSMGSIQREAITGVNETIKTIKDGSYPIYTNGYIVTRKNPDDNTKKWVENVLGKRGSKIIENAGYVPMN